jgi:hypothetical protein
MTFDRFIGPSYAAQSPNVDVERSMNLYAEAVEGGAAGKARNVLYGTPGLVAFATITGIPWPVQTLWANDTSCYGIAGGVFFQLFANGTSTQRGTVGATTSTAKIVPNGNEVLILCGQPSSFMYVDPGTGPAVVTYSAGLSGTVRVGAALFGNSPVSWLNGDKFGTLYAGATITIAAVAYTVSIVYDDQNILLSSTASVSLGAAYSTAPLDILASDVAFFDGYFVLVQPSSNRFNISAINDASTWDPLDYASKEGYPDNILAILTDHEELWLFGTDTTEVWQNTGAALFPLQRIPGAFIHHGCAAKASPVRLANGVAWLSSDAARGGTIAYLAQGFIPTRISTHAEETAWDSYSTVADAKAWTYTEAGHEFWVIDFPTANATWVFDATSGWWHERGFWNGSGFDLQLQQCHCFAFGKHLVGDRRSGLTNAAIYQQALGIFTDAGTAIHRVRTAPHISNEQNWSFYNRFQLDLQVGQSASSPSVSLDWSDDGGHTFRTSPIVATPTDATFAGRVVWRRLGRSRDRVFRITITDAVPIALIAAYLDVEQGNC